MNSQFNVTISSPHNFSLATFLSPHLAKAIIVLELCNTYYIPVIVALGLIGNILSFLAFFCTHLKLRSSSYYLGCLAVSDFGYLIMLLCVWLNRNGIEVMNRPGWCQLIVYLSSSFSCWSVWLTVSFTAERFVAVNYPLWRLQLGTNQRARLVVAFTALLSFTLNSCLLIFVGVADDGLPTPTCGLLRQFSKAMHYINIVDTVLTLVIPVVLIIYMNFMIGRALYQFYSHHKSQRTASVQGEGSSKPEQVSDVDLVGEMLLRRPQMSCTTQCTRPLPQATQVTIARMLLLVSTVFILLNLPSYVVRLHGFVLELRGSPIGMEVYTLQGYFMLLYYTNFAINFVVYNISSRMFRRALRDYLAKLAHTTYTFLVANRMGTSSEVSNFG